MCLEQFRRMSGKTARLLFKAKCGAIHNLQLYHGATRGVCALIMGMSLYYLIDNTLTALCRLMYLFVCFAQYSRPSSFKTHHIIYMSLYELVL